MVKRLRERRLLPARVELLEERRVLSVLVPAGATWKYLEQHVDLGTAWRAPDFDDSAWSSGPAELGFGDATAPDNRPEATVVDFGINPGNKRITTYFRHEFQVADPLAFGELNLALLRDDGAAVYLNGSEIARDNLAAGAGFNAVAATRIDSLAETWLNQFAGISPSLLVPGRNVLAAEVHLWNQTDDDLSFDLALHSTQVQAMYLDDIVSGAVDLLGELDQWRFTAGANQRVFLDADQSTTAHNLGFRLRAPNGAPLAQSFIDAPGFDLAYDIPLTILPVSGTYTIDVYSRLGTTGNYTFHLVDVPPPDVQAIQLGDAVTGEIRVPGDHDEWLLTFTGNQKKLFLDVSQLSPTEPLDTFSFTVYDPGNAGLAQRIAQGPNATEQGDIGPLVLSTPGTYKIEVIAFGTGTGSYAFHLYDIAPPDQQAINAGELVGGVIELPGRTDRWPLSVAANRRVFIDVQQITGGVLDVRLLNPGGTVVATSTGSSADPHAADSGAHLLNALGTWTIEVDGVGDDTPAYQFRLLDVPAPDVQPLLFGQVAVGAIETPGAADEWHFAAPANQTIFLDVQQVGTSGPVAFRVRYASVGATLYTSTATPANPDFGDIGPSSLGTAAANWMVEVDGEGASTGSYRFVLFSVVNEQLTASLNTLHAGAIETPGSTDVWTLAIAQNKSVFLDLHEIAGSDRGLDFRLTEFGGAPLTSHGASGAPDEADLGPVVLLGPGQYTLTVDAAADDVGTYQFVLHDVATPALDTFVPAGAVWKYLDDGSDQGAAWIAPGFNDTAWASGPAELGYGDGDEATTVGFGPDQFSRNVTTYFRRTFEVQDPARFLDLTLALKRDDGAAVYLNGVEIGRDNLADNAPYNMLAKDIAFDDGRKFLPFNGIPANRLVAGTNTLAVEIHQANITSSDISFDLALYAGGPHPTPIQLGAAVAGNIETPGAFDAWEFTASAGTPVRLGVYQIGGSGQLLDFTLNGPTGGTLFTSTGNSANPHAADQGPFILPATGTYRLFIDGRGDDVADYQFRISSQPTQVVGRHVFYNNSAWDGNDSAPGASDDAAIATDKQLLLPGQTAALANYTNFSKGINGIMIDVANMPSLPTLADFQFRVGNDNNPSAWTAPTVAPTLAVRLGAGSSGSDRITLIWPDGAIKKQWLQVTMLPTLGTGLVGPDVFYFGNAIGEIGDSPVQTQVNATDQIQIRVHPRNLGNLAPIDFTYDINRDRQVNAADELLARGNPTNLATMLRLITPPAAPAIAAQLAEAVFGGVAKEACNEPLPRRRPAGLRVPG